MKILIIEDNKLLAESLAESLLHQRYMVDIVYDGEDAWMQVKWREYNVILLDLKLPDLSGIEFCKNLRSQGSLTPILVISGNSTTENIALALDAGADDYLVKPLNLMEVSARVRALLRRGNCISFPILEWQGLRLDPCSYEITYYEKPVYLTVKEFKILELLLRNPQRVFNRSSIIDFVWQSEDYPGEDTVKTHIRSIRSKLKAIVPTSDLIETVYNVGYRLKTSQNS